MAKAIWGECDICGGSPAHAPHGSGVKVCISCREDFMYGCHVIGICISKGLTPEYELYLKLSNSGMGELANKTYEDWVNGQVRKV